MNWSEMKKAKTNFEQVPVAKIARLRRDPAPKASRKKGSVLNDIVVERPMAKTEPYSVRKAV